MMFKEVLKEVVEGTEGGVAGLLMGYDGITVDQYVREEGEGIDVQTVGMEYSVILSGVKQAVEMLEVGSAVEVSIKAEQLTTVVRYLTDEYFIAMTLVPGANVGKARYMLRTRGTRLVAELT
jgi:predicted regulator of Ras-like GTPase activity (Roadblock/LC7/MglB family)